MVAVPIAKAAASARTFLRMEASPSTKLDQPSTLNAQLTAIHPKCFTLENELISKK
jgi:hypothetical protein